MEREKGTGVVNTEEALNILRDIIANAENYEPLRRVLINEFKPESRLNVVSCTVPAELIESGMKALGMDYPKAPKPRKVPDVPTDTQAKILEAMRGDDGVERQLVSKSGIRVAEHGYYIEMPLDRFNVKVREATYQALRDFKWIAFTGERDRWSSFYKLSQAGREALARYEAKKATKESSVASSSTD